MVQQQLLQQMKQYILLVLIQVVLSDSLVLSVVCLVLSQLMVLFLVMVLLRLHHLLTRLDLSVEILEIISVHDSKESYSIKCKVLDFSKCFDGDISGMKIGIPKNYFGDGLDEDVKIPVLEAAKTLEKLGATLEEF